MTPTPQEQSNKRRYTDLNQRDYDGTVGDFKTHSLKCTINHFVLSMHMNFIVRENVDPSTRGVLADIPGFAQLYLEYFSPTELFLIFKSYLELAHPDIPAYKFRIQRGV